MGSDYFVLADDSGLEIDALGGEPGVDSANYMGRETPYDVRHERILELMADVPEKQRAARFVCVIAVMTPDFGVKTFRAVVDGRIAAKPAGGGGFGYDPIFFVPELGATTAELSKEQKNAISHRGKALRMALDFMGSF